jgi:hypothetical protein
MHKVSINTFGQTRTLVDSGGAEFALSECAC